LLASENSHFEDEMKLISAAFVKAQSAFAPALKTSNNPHFKSRYADLASCIDAVLDALNTNGIALLQKTHPDDSGVTVETLFIHESGESMSGGTLHVPAAKSDPQGYGSALTYARRYSLMASCGIAPEDDDGNAATKASKPPTKAEKAEAEKRAKRGAELDEMASELVRLHKDGCDLSAIGIWYDPSNWIKEDEQDERLYVWGQLKEFSELRSAIKANRPEAA